MTANQSVLPWHATHGLPRPSTRRSAALEPLLPRAVVMPRAGGGTITLARPLRPPVRGALGVEATTCRGTHEQRAGFGVEHRRVKE